MKHFYLLLFSIILLKGCAFSQEELLEQMVPPVRIEEGCYRLWVVFESEEQVFSGEFDIELSEDSKSKMLHSPIHAWDRGEWNYTKAFNINEYPTFIIVDNIGLVLQTTSLQEADEFLSSQLSECE